MIDNEEETAETMDPAMLHSCRVLGMKQCETTYPDTNTDT